MSSCIARTDSPICSPKAAILSANSVNGMAHLLVSISIIITKSSCNTDWVTSRILLLYSAQAAEILAKIPTSSLPITVMTARILKSSLKKRLAFYEIYHYSNINPENCNEYSPQKSGVAGSMNNIEKFFCKNKIELDNFLKELFERKEREVIHRDIENGILIKIKRD